MGCISKCYLNSYLPEDLNDHWQNLQQFWINASKTRKNDKLQSFNKWIKSNEKPSTEDVEYANEYMNDKIDIKGDFC